MVLSNFSSPGQIQPCDDEIVDEDTDVACLPMDDIAMSEQGSEDREDPASENEEEILDFPGDTEMDPIMPDLDVPDMDIVAPDLELESHASLKVTQVGARTGDPGVSMLTSAYSVMRGVL